MQLIPSQENKIMPWKNGLGITREIDISPVGADLAHGNFDFRVSSASVSMASAFSTFPGYDRILCVIQGAGISINEKSYSLFEIFRFAGEEIIVGGPLEGELIDLGIIYRRDQFIAEMKKIEKSQSLNLSDGIHYIFCVNGKVRSEAHTLEASDTLKIEMPLSLTLSLDHGAVAFLISLKTIR